MNKIAGEIIRGDHLALRYLTLSDVGEAYLRWLHDYETTRYTESRHATHTIESLREYLGKCVEKKADHLFGIIEIKSGRHVGNIKVGPINPYYRTASVGLIVGEKDCWGKGYGTEAIGLVICHAFLNLALHKLTAGVVAGNVYSLRAFTNNHFVVEGVRRKQNLCDDAWHDEIMLGLLRDEYEKA